MIQNILPVFNDNYYPLVFSSSEEYVPYLAVALRSLVENLSEQYNYDIVIMENKLSENSRNRLSSLYTRENVSIRFYNLSKVVDENDFCVRGHLAVETFFKFFIPRIFETYKRVLFVDSDVVFQADPATLYNIDMQGYSLAASLCCLWNGIANTDKNFKRYGIDVLKLSDINKYFQCGVLLMDIKKLNKEKIYEKCMDKALKKMYTCMDQDVFNFVFDGRICYIDNKWNYETRQKGFKEEIPNILPEIRKKYDDAQKSPYIIHYSGKEKPWWYPDEEFADIWWSYARQTPFYELLLERMFNFKVSEKQKMLKTSLINLRNFNRNKFRSLKYKIMSFMTIGKKRQKYKEKYRKNKQILISTMEFLKNV